VEPPLAELGLIPPKVKRRRRKDLQKRCQLTSLSLRHAVLSHGIQSPSFCHAVLWHGIQSLSLCHAVPWHGIQRRASWSLSCHRRSTSEKTPDSADLTL